MSDANFTDRCVTKLNELANYVRVLNGIHETIDLVYAQNSNEIDEHKSPVSFFTDKRANLLLDNVPLESFRVACSRFHRIVGSHFDQTCNMMTFTAGMPLYEEILPKLEANLVAGELVGALVACQNIRTTAKPKKIDFSD